MIKTSTPNHSKEHFYYLDWLRVLAFTILLLEHSAEVFTEWVFWVKNQETSSSLSYIVSFFLPWRMPLLFIISGAAITLSFKRRTMSEVLSERIKRLLLPLFVAILFVIPPQIYFIKAFKGYDESFITFYKDILLFKFNWSPTGNIHYIHLWYLAFVFIYSVLSLPLLNVFKSEKGKILLLKAARILDNPYYLFSLGFLLIFPYYALKQFLIGNTTAVFVYYFPFFIFGSLFATNKIVLDAIKKYSNAALFLAIILTINFYYFSLVEKDPYTYFLNSGRVQSLPHLLLKSLNQWLWVLAIFGLGMRFLNKGSSLLNYATKAVYPFYIFHQTVIVGIAYFVIQMSAPVSIKLAAIIVSSFLLILITYEYVLKRTAITRVMFGIKMNISKREATLLPLKPESNTPTLVQKVPRSI